MFEAALLTVALLGGDLPVPPHVEKFPEPAYAVSGRHVAEKFVQLRWPPPARLAEIWERCEHQQTGRVAWLLGAGAFHDADLLPVYAEAVTDPDERVRQAAAFGYRVLLADAPPARAPEVSPEAGEKLQDSILRIHRELRQQPLAQLWLDSLLAAEDQTLSGRRQLVFNRPPEACADALDELLIPPDLPLVAQAFLRAETQRVRIPLLRLLQTLTMHRFIEKPRGERRGWSSSRVYNDGIADAEAWLDGHCTIDYQQQIRDAFGRAGITGIDPLGSPACDAWLHVLEKMPSEWWPMAAFQLHRCGAPSYRVSWIRPDSQLSTTERATLLRWYGVR